MPSAAEEARLAARHKGQVLAYLEAAEQALKHDALSRCDEHLTRWQLEVEEAVHHGGDDDSVYALTPELEDLAAQQRLLRRSVERMRVRVENM